MVVMERLKPGCEDQLEEFQAEINCQLEKISWLSGFYSLPPSIQIANSKAYQGGKVRVLNMLRRLLNSIRDNQTFVHLYKDVRTFFLYTKIYGIDAASGAAVAALDISARDHVLDLCAAPGAKLCMILDLLGDTGSVTGVDVSRQRLAACRTMLQKYELGNHCRLFVADGTKFSLIPVRVHLDSKPCRSISSEDVEILKEWTSRRTWKERKMAARAKENYSSQHPELIFYGRNSGVVGLSKVQLYKNVSDNEILRCGYDKVLVDAECTHDGSIKHIQKFEHWGWKTLQRRVLNADRTDSLTLLQLKLLTNGFRLLKIGGLVVYSTCSLTVAQNENVVEQFLKENPCAELQEIEAAKSWPCRGGGLPKTLRFDPFMSQTSGLFLAKFKKLMT